MMPSAHFLALLLILLVGAGVKALEPNVCGTSSRRGFLKSAAFVPFAGVLSSSPAGADEGNSGVTDSQVKEVVLSDILDRKFLVTGQLTKSIYRPTATFTDEIDTYGLEQWMKGTSRLFVGDKSSIRLVGDVDVTPELVSFRFDEDLMFRIPFNPVVSLTGTVFLTRDKEGYITSYKEKWDQDVATVIKSARF